MKASLKNSFITNENLNDELFYTALAEELNAIMEEELSKSYEDINAEIIDDCCTALTAIYELQNGETENPNNVTVINNIIKKYKLQQTKKYVMAAACAAVAIISVGVATFSVEGNTIEGNIIKNAFGKFETLLTIKAPTTEPPTETTEPTTTQQITTTDTPITTEALNEIKSITILPPPGFYSTFSSRESISLTNFFVCVNYTNGTKEVVPISDATYEICETQNDGLTEIRVYYKGSTSSVYVTVLPEEELNPVTISSIYGAFENGYTIEDMKVFAVYSDGTEKEIPKSECKITTEEYSDGGETGTIVTVEYENCSFQFLSE